jgi:hypothetical protein
VPNVAETFISRNQLFRINDLVHDHGVDCAGKLRDRLAEIGIKVEEDATVGDDELSDGSIYRLAEANGYNIAADVSVRDVRSCYPWLTADEAVDVAVDACNYLADPDSLGDARRDAIANALHKNGLEIDPAVEEGTWQTPAGLYWTPTHEMLSQDPPWSVVWCSDGRVFAQDGSDWYLQSEEEVAGFVHSYLDKEGV